MLYAKIAMTYGKRNGRAIFAMSQKFSSKLPNPYEVPLYQEAKQSNETGFACLLLPIEPRRSGLD